MAAYPPFGMLMDSSAEWLDDLVLDRAVGGGARGRAFYPVKKFAFTAVHALTLAEYAQLESFYDANRLLPVAMLWCPNGVTYTVLFDGPPGKADTLRPGIVKVTVKLAQQ